jgi:hypothetical protein
VILSYIQASLSGGFLELYEITKHKEPVYTATGLLVKDLGQDGSAEEGEIYLEVKTIGEIYHQLF